jgi:hypothetical protein
MAVHGQFHDLDTVLWVKTTLCPQSRRPYGPQGWAVILGNPKYFAIARIETHTFWVRRIYSVLLFIVIVITDFSLSGLDLKVLTLNDERYIIYEAKEPVLHVQERRLIWEDKTVIAYPYRNTKDGVFIVIVKWKNGVTDDCLLICWNKLNYQK